MDNLQFYDSVSVIYSITDSISVLLSAVLSVEKPVPKLERKD